MTNSISQNIPTHVGIILDGNRRWAKQRGLTPLEGHRRGYQNLKTIGQSALARGVKYLSAYVFSTENWNRSKTEVDYLMNLLHWVATHETAEMNRKNIKLRFVGSRDGLSDKIIKAIDAAETKTAGNTGGTLALCLNYGGRQEITDAVKRMLTDGVKAQDVTPSQLAQYLYAPDIPDLDLVIRTSGVQRLSNFMLWRAAYAELYFTDKFWPDFTPADLDVALADYAARPRRFGGDERAAVQAESNNGVTAR